MGNCSSEQKRHISKEQSKLIRQTNFITNVEAKTQQKTLRTIIYQIFDKYDKNHSGVLSKTEAQTMIREMQTKYAVSRVNKSDGEQVNKFFEKADLDKDGKITKQQLYLFYVRK